MVHTVTDHLHFIVMANTVRDHPYRTIEVVTVTYHLYFIVTLNTVTDHLYFTITVIYCYSNISSILYGYSNLLLK